MLIKIQTSNFVPVPKEVVKWNSWDGEHLANVHSGYENPLVLLEGTGWCVAYDYLRLPGLPFIKARVFVIAAQVSKDKQVTYSNPFGVLNKTVIELVSENGGTRVNTTYLFDVPLLFRPLIPLLRRLVKKWAVRIWSEDYPVKLRRAKALAYGFRDFHGIPNAIADRENRLNTYVTEIPVTRLPDGPENQHPFREKVLDQAAS
jgi:hypothetical protein